MAGPTPPSHPSTIEDRRIDGQYGEVWHEGVYQGDILEITGRIAIERREIPRAGNSGVVFRRGRVSREGSFRIGKIDSRFENKILQYIRLSPDEKRKLRRQGIAAFPDTWLTIKVDDPDSWGVEEIQLLGVKIWEVGIGFTMGDLLEREIPFTWESENLVKGIARAGNKQQWTVDPDQDGDNQTWPAAGASDLIW